MKIFLGRSNNVPSSRAPFLHFVSQCNFVHLSLPHHPPPISNHPPETYGRVLGLVGDYHMLYICYVGSSQTKKLKYMVWMDLVTFVQVFFVPGTIVPLQNLANNHFILSTLRESFMCHCFIGHRSLFEPTFVFKEYNIHIFWTISYHSDSLKLNYPT